MRAKGFGIQLISPISKTHIRFAGYSFVGNTDLLQVISALKEYGFAIISIKKSIDAWEAGLKVTRGALVQEKTFWYLIDFAWRGGEWSYKSIQDTPGKVFANDITGQRLELRRVEPHIAEETLGIFMKPTGDTSRQAQKMLQQSTQWASDVKQGKLKKKAWISLISTLWRSLSYPLPALNLTKEQCKKIMAPAIEYVLMAMDIYCHFPRALVFATEKTLA